MFDKWNFARTMVVRRKSLGLTKADLAEKLEVTRKTIGAWENPESDAMPRDIKILDKWCEIVGLSLGEALDNRPLPDVGVINNPEHLSAVRYFYGRYLHDRPFARIIHKISACDNETLATINTLLERLALAGLREESWVEQTDLSWEKTINLAREHDTEPSNCGS